MDMEPVQSIQPNQEEQRPVVKPSAEPSIKKSPHPQPFLVVMVVLFIAAVAAAGYLGSQYKQKRDDNKSLQSRVTTLTNQLNDANKALTAEKQKEAAAASSASSSSSATLTALKANITAALNSKNTAALQGYMASSVTFVLAATENGPADTAAQAVTDLTSHTSSATTPWNFDLPATTLSSYASGDYHQYFGSGAIVGKSANNYVVSFTVNSSGKISTVFVSANADLL